MLRSETMATWAGGPDDKARAIAQAVDDLAEATKAYGKAGYQVVAWRVDIDDAKGEVTAVLTTKIQEAVKRWQRP